MFMAVGGVDVSGKIQFGKPFVQGAFQFMKM
jgi:hypothetical protein